MKDQAVLMPERNEFRFDILHAWARAVIACDQGTSQEGVRHEPAKSRPPLGCTPDDVTRVAVAAAFGVPLHVNAEHADLLERTSTWARGELAQSAAALPEGGQMIVGHADGVRGFLIENVLVLPGNPPEMQAMFETFIRNYPPPAAQICRATLSFMTTEDAMRTTLGQFEAAFPEVELGSYADPMRTPDCVTLVLRSRDQRMLRDACTWFDRFGLRSKEHA